MGSSGGRSSSNAQATRRLRVLFALAAPALPIKGRPPRPGQLDALAPAPPAPYVGPVIEDDDDLTPAATVVVLRDTPAGLEVLMLRRNNEGSFGGMWVFPGGRVDDHEIVPGDSLASARRAAVREAEEECGLVIAPDDMETWSHWVPPAAPQMDSGRGPVRRFSTWFFVTHAPEGDVAVDGDEIHDHVWIAPSEAKARRDAGEIDLVPPTWVTLHELEAHSTVAEAMAWARSREPELFRTRPIGKEPRTVAWFGDVAYTGGPADADGPRHRLIMHAEGWVYDRLDV